MSADASHERFDPLLLNIATTTSGIDELLDIFLGFLRRKTDAFTPPGGFPQLRDSFVASLKRQFDLAQAAKAAKEAKASKQAAPAAGKVAPPTSTKSAPVAAAPAADIIEKGASGAFDISGGAAADTAVSAAADTLPTSAPSVPMPHAGERAADTGPLPSDSLAAAAAITTSTGAAAAAAPPLASDAAPSPAAAGAGLATPVPGGNGGTTDRYSWSQTLSEVTLVFPLPAGIKTKDITADIKSRSLRVHIRGAATPLIDGALPKRIKTDDSYWTLGQFTYCTRSRSFEALATLFSSHSQCPFNHPFSLDNAQTIDAIHALTLDGLPLSFTRRRESRRRQVAHCISHERERHGLVEQSGRE